MNFARGMRSPRVRRAWLLAGCVLLALFGPAPDARADDSTATLRVLGFYDFNYFANDAEHDEAVNSGFYQGQLVLHGISRLSERGSFFTELSLAPASPFKVNVERAILKFELSNLAQLSFGRYHTPINWWNAAFHHGLWLQSTRTRPEMTRFGGTFIPVHFVGFLGQGGVDGPGASLDYELGVGNGRSSDLAGGGDAGDVNGNRAWLVHAFLRPDALYALRLGGAFYRDKITPEAGEDLDESIISGYVVLTRETPEILAEVAQVRHEESAGAGSYESTAYYVQAAYRLPWWQDRLKPYARYENMAIDPDDPAFGNLLDLERSVFGLRADVSRLAALKIEVQRDRLGAGDWINGIYFQLSLVF